MIIWRRTTILQLALALAIHVQAQDSLKYSALSINAGLNNIANKDFFQSPYTYRGNNFSLNSNFTKASAKGMHILDLKYSNGQVKSIVSPRANTALLLFNYDYLFRIKSEKINKKLSTFVGFGLHTLASSTNYLPKLESSQNYLSANAFIKLSGAVFYQASKKSTLFLQVGLSMLGVVYRPDFEINGSSLSKLSFVGKSNQSSIKLEYRYQIRPKVFLTVNYTYSYFKFNEPKPLIILQNGLLFGLKRNF